MIFFDLLFFVCLGGFFWLATGLEEEQNAKDVAIGLYKVLQLFPLDVIASTVPAQAIRKCVLGSGQRKETTKQRFHS